MNYLIPLFLVAADYIPVLETLTFGPTTNRKCFNVTTVEDQIFEEDIEDVNLYLSTMAMGITFTPELAQVHIRDDDSKLDSYKYNHIIIYYLIFHDSRECFKACNTHVQIVLGQYPLLFSCECMTLSALYLPLCSSSLQNNLKLQTLADS